MSNYINRFTISIAGFLGFDFALPFIKRRLVNNNEDKSSEIQRVRVPPLQGLKDIFEEIKFKFYNIKGVKWTGLINGFSYDDYWVDEAGYKISEQKFSEIIKTTHELHNMCLEATDFAIQDDEILQKVFDIPPDMIPMIKESWSQRQPDLLSRYDFLMGKEGELYFLEVNGDTPSGIIEAGPAQRKWAQQLKLLQFNTLEQNIAEGFKKIIERNQKSKLLMFKNSTDEDSCTFEYLKSLIEPSLKASITTHLIEDFEAQLEKNNSEEGYKKSIFWRQYPLEWLASETPREYFKNPTFYKNPSQVMIEPPWKIVMSNKAMSVLLNAMYPNNRHIIYSSLAPLNESEVQLSKQKYSREGEDILFSSDYDLYFRNFLIDSYYRYVHNPIFQSFKTSDLHQNRYLTISSWIVYGQPCGILLREDLNRIIGTGSSVVPYFIKKDENDDRPIQIELENTENQQKLRQSVYDTTHYNTNDMMINIQQRVGLLPNNKFDSKSIKQTLILQYNTSQQKREQLHSINPEELEEDQLISKNNPILVGFSPLFFNRPVGQGQTLNQEQERSFHSNGGGNFLRIFGNSSNEPTQAKTPPKSGQTGKSFSSHS